MGERAEYTGSRITPTEETVAQLAKETNPAKNKTKYSLYISQVPYTATKVELAEYFEKSGCSVKSCRVVTTGKPGSKKSKGVAFIDCDDGESYRKGLKLHRAKFGDRKINVRPTLSHVELEKKVNQREQKLAKLFAKGKAEQGKKENRHGKKSKPDRSQASNKMKRKRDKKRFKQGNPSKRRGLKKSKSGNEVVVRDRKGVTK